MNLTTGNVTVTTIAFLMLLAFAAAGQKQQSSNSQELPPNQLIEREITGSETHRYKFDLQANEFFQVRAEQNGIDVVLVIIDMKNNVLAAMDSPNFTAGPETLSFVVGEPSSLVLEVKVLDAKAAKGNYTLLRSVPHRFTLGDQWRIKAEQSFMAGMTTQNVPGKEEIAISLFSEAQAMWQQIGDNYMAQQTAQQVSFLKATLAYKEAHTLAAKGTSKSLRAAVASFQEAHRWYHESGNKQFEALSLNALGHVYVLLAENRKALACHLQSLSLTNDNQVGKGTTLDNIATVYLYLGEDQKALEYYDQALEIWRTIREEKGEAMTQLGIGLVYSHLGQAQKALDRLNQALEISTQGADKSGQAAALNNIGTVYHTLGDDQKSLYYYLRSLSLRKAIRDRRGEAQALNNIGLAHARLGNNQKALEHYNKALRLQRSTGDKSGEGSTLNNIGLAYSNIGDHQKALRYYNEALSISRVVDEKGSEATTLSNAMFLWADLGNPRIAVFYGKQAVNKYQELRQGIQGLENETQKSFLGTIGNVYKKLADLLIADGRLLEAEQVLAMLKEEEVFDYLRRDASETNKLQQRADLTPAETAALKRYNEIADRITALGEELRNLDELRRKGIKLTEEQEKRAKELSQQIQDANHVFEVFLREVAEEFAKRPHLATDLSESTGLQFDVESWGKGVVYLYTLVGEDRYRVVLIASKVKTDGKSDIKAAALDEKIEAFRQAVQNPSSDPRPLGKELYDILIKPIEKQLEGAKADTLLWSLDGNLRLLPLAALWDGKQYFGQKYKNVIVTRASLTRLGSQYEANWRALALGVSKPKAVRDPNGVGNYDFGALPAVKDELLSIVQSTQSPNGVMPGQSLIDDEFNEPALENQLVRGYKVVHIASHFSLNPGNSTKSFLLLGDGSPLTVEEIRTNPQLEFKGVELLTLSACQTALVGKDTSGQEIEGLGYVAQTRGAKAILATLWRVADDSTGILMSRFYRLRKENPTLSKAAVLQLAQMEMIEGRMPTPTAGQRQAIGETDSAGKTSTAYSYDPKNLHSHPYFWAPFILIGNWR